ncbi:MAG: Fe-S cluster assembly protein SufD [Cyanobacteria bacterium J06639_1]
MSQLTSELVADSAEARALSRLLESPAELNAATLGSDRAAWLESIQQAARDRLHNSAFPTTRDEEWRFTPLKSLLEPTFQEADIAKVDIEAGKGAIASYMLPEAKATRLVFVNGTFSPDLSDVADAPEGLAIGSLGTLSDEQWQVARSHFTLDVMGQADTFALLNSARTRDIAIVHASKNCMAETPIHLIWLSTTADEPTASYPRCLVVADRGSSLRLVEQSIGTEDATYFANAVTEVVLAENARIEHCKLQEDAAASFSISRTTVSQARDSHYSCVAISTGAKLSRHSLSTEHRGTNATTILNGLTLLGDKQIADTHTAIDHAQPQGTSRQLHKCIVGDRARAVFNGRVIVRQDAQQIDSSQSSRNLLLSSKARVDTKPQLEIFADDVKCAHGATVSQLEEDELFYLQSRGLTRVKAEQLLTFAFAADIIDRVSIPSLATRLKQFVLEQSAIASRSE